ncbi:MAG: imidazole glycerol phosphate synthase subunit HisH [Rhizobiales bacterium PAR1]|nr:MAG: imidazole glycerol phosphate synthase subunit HisH [Rhizobiales bacterium PAR1]
MKIALIDYGAGNLHSAGKALERAMIEAGVSGHIVLGANPDDIAEADRIVLPGDGAYRDCRENLSLVDGLEEVLTEQVRVKGRPFLGICVGMQLLSDIGEERGETQGLGWIPGRVVALDPKARYLKVPHMGWNTLERRGEHPVLDGLTFGEGGLHAYFLHSYHLLPTYAADLLATADYGGPVSAIVGRDTVIGTQFHPEKSQALGIKLLANFVKWSP